MGYEGKLQFVGLSDRGMMRSNNEDAIGMDYETGLVLVADGMGGYKAGEIASGIAIKTIREHVAKGLPAARKQSGPSDSGYAHESVLLRNAILRANEIIYETAKSQPQCEGMGTTVIACLFHHNRVSIAHVGDSRLYRLRRDSFEQLTSDHSLLQELVARGFYTPEEARKSLNKNLVTRALGVESSVQVDLQEDLALVGDIYLLCSDGLNDMVEDEDIRLTTDTFSDNLETAARQLIKLANDNGGRDNISVVLAKPLKPFNGGKKSFLERMTEWFT